MASPGSLELSLLRPAPFVAVSFVLWFRVRAAARAGGPMRKTVWAGWVLFLAGSALRCTQLFCGGFNNDYANGHVFSIDDYCPLATANLWIGAPVCLFLPLVFWAFRD